MPRGSRLLPSRRRGRAIPAIRRERLRARGADGATIVSWTPRWLAATVRAALAEALALVLPVVCAGCGEPDVALCEVCRGRARARRRAPAEVHRSTASRSGAGCVRGRRRAACCGPQGGRAHRPRPRARAGAAPPRVAAPLRSRADAGRSCRCRRRARRSGGAGTGWPNSSRARAGLPWRRCSSQTRRTPISAVSTSDRRRENVARQPSGAGCRGAARASCSTTWSRPARPSPRRCGRCASGGRRGGRRRDDRGDAAAPGGQAAADAVAFRNS